MLGLLNLEMAHQYGTFGNEFIVTFKNSEKKETIDFELRKKMIKKKNRENRI